MSFDVSDTRCSTFFWCLPPFFLGIPIKREWRICSFALHWGTFIMRPAAPDPSVEVQKKCKLPTEIASNQSSALHPCGVWTEPLLLICSRWRPWSGRAATTTSVISGPSASRRSSWPSCSRPCSTCTRCAPSSSCPSPATRRPRSRTGPSGAQTSKSECRRRNRLDFSVSQPKLEKSAGKARCASHQAKMQGSERLSFARLMTMRSPKRPPSRCI